MMVHFQPRPQQSVHDAGQQKIVLENAAGQRGLPQPLARRRAGGTSPRTPSRDRPVEAAGDPARRHLSRRSRTICRIIGPNESTSVPVRRRSRTCTARTASAVAARAARVWRRIGGLPVVGRADGRGPSRAETASKSRPALGGQRRADAADDHPASRIASRRDRAAAGTRSAAAASPPLGGDSSSAPCARDGGSPPRRRAAGSA